MSRIGKKPVPVPQGVTAQVEGQTVTAKGPKGELRFVVNDEVLVKLENDAIAVDPRDQSKDTRSKWGMSRTQIANILQGVKDGFEKRLEINGVGYRAAEEGRRPVAGAEDFRNDGEDGDAVPEEEEPFGGVELYGCWIRHLGRLLYRWCLGSVSRGVLDGVLKEQEEPRRF